MKQGYKNKILILFSFYTALLASIWAFFDLSNGFLMICFSHLFDIKNVNFSLVTTLRCRLEGDSFPWIAQLYPWSILYNAEC